MFLTLAAWHTIQNLLVVCVFLSLSPKKKSLEGLISFGRGQVKKSGAFDGRDRDATSASGTHLVRVEQGRQGAAGREDTA